MDGNPNHGFLQEDVSYDDLMNNDGWPGSGDQYAYPPAPATQPQFPQYSTSQPSFNQYNLSQQPSYIPSSFSNSPYTSQYQQHARPDDMFAPAAYNVDPSLQSFHGSDPTFPYNPQENATISPHSLQYGALSNQQVNHGASNTNFQHSANFNQRSQGQATAFNNAPSSHMLSASNPLQYPNIQNGPSEYDMKQPVTRNFDIIIPANSPQPKSAPIKQEPKLAQEPVRVTRPALPAAKNKSSRPLFEHAPWIVLDNASVEVPAGLKNTIPKYRPRKSRSGKELIPGVDVSHVSTSARSTKKIRVPKDTKSISKYKGTSQAPAHANRLANLRDGTSLSASSKSPTPTESSSEEEGTSSEEESEDEEDDEMPLEVISDKRGEVRPTDVVGGARWDAIGLVWRPPHISHENEDIKAAIEAYANAIVALRGQFKENTAKSLEAASRPADVARLAAERSLLFDQFYEFVNAAIEYGYTRIVEHLGNHQKFLAALTTTLMECIKENDYLGKLPKAIFKLLTKIRNLSEEFLMKKLKFDGIQKRWIKRADDDIKKDIALILASTIEARDRTEKTAKEAAQVEEKKKILERAEQLKSRHTEAAKAKAGSTSTKRPHEGDGTTKPNKKFASDVAGAPSVHKLIPAKRPTASLGAKAFGLNTTTTRPVIKKTEHAAPSTSTIGSILADIARPPEPPKAPKAPVNPSETPEEKKRRERKESRRHLRVKFKEGPELEQVRLFKHEQAEDEGRQDDMLRDAHDDRSEGMMHKKRVSENMDASLDDDEGVPGEFEDRPYPGLINIDLANLDTTSKFGQGYTTRGGSRTFTTAEQETQQRREALELMVIYTDPSDIPPSPKEPGNTDIQQLSKEVEIRGPTAPWIVQRLQEIQQYGPEYAIQIFASRNQEQKLSIHPHGMAQPLAPSTHFNPALENLSLVGTQPSVQPHQQQPPQVNPVADMDPQALQNLISIVNSLKGKPYPPIEPPSWMNNEGQIAGWWEGYYGDNTSKDKQAAQTQQAQVQTSQYHAPPPEIPQVPAPQMPIPQMQPYLPVAAPSSLPSFPQNPTYPHVPQVDVNPQFQAYLASITNAQNGKGSTNQNYDVSPWSNGNNGHEDNIDSRRDKDWNNDDYLSRSKSNPNDHNPSSKKPYEPLDANGEYKGKKKPCRFWQLGKCAKGPKCTFLHDNE